MPLSSISSAHAGRVEKSPAAQTPVQRAQALHARALEQIASGHAGTAAQTLAEALKLEPTLHAARIALGQLLLEQGHAAEAERVAQEGLGLGPMGTMSPPLGAASAPLHYLLARAQAERGDAAGAIAHLDAMAPASADGLGLRAGLRAQQGDFKRALLDYEHALRAQPGNSLWWLGLGVALEAEGRAQQARQAYGRAQQLGVGGEELASFVDKKMSALAP